ncbi:MAG: hypothetical protein ACREE9_13375, partial [Stellaceae bacterium]
PRPLQAARAVVSSVQATAYSVACLSHPTLSDASQGGRKPVIVAEKLQRAKGMIAKGLTVREAATRLKVGKTAS